jgi:hypothetical protein
MAQIGSSSQSASSGLCRTRKSIPILMAAQLSQLTLQTSPHGRKSESKARHLLAQKLHDSTLTKLLHLDTVAKMWSALTTEFTVKSSHVVAAMRTAFDNLKCAKNGNVRVHLDKLRLKYEELVGVGVTILPSSMPLALLDPYPFPISATSRPLKPLLVRQPLQQLLKLPLARAL